MLQLLSQFAQMGTDGQFTSRPNLEYYDPYATNSAAQDAVSAGMAVAMSIIILIVVVVTIVGLWKVFTKAGKPGWAAIVPIYNNIVMLEIAGKPLWWVFLYFIPVVNIVIPIIVSIEIAKKFGKSGAFGVIALWLFAPIGYLILGFGKAQYQGGGAPTTSGGAYGAGSMGAPAQSQVNAYHQEQPGAATPQQPAADPNQPQNQNPQGPLPPQPPTNLVQ